MGDRANIVVKYRDEQVCLYAHWNGEYLPKTLQDALLRSERWDDFQYLTRIIFCQMLTNGGECLPGAATGFGLSQKISDGSNRVIVVDVDSQLVELNTHKITFMEYIGISNAFWNFRRDKPAKELR